MVSEESNKGVTGRPDSRPSLLVENIDNGLQLSLADLIGLVGLPLVQSLSDTENDLQSSLNSGLGLLSDKLVGVSEHLSSFRVSDDYPRDGGILELSGGDLSGEGTALGGVTVLSGDLDGGLDLLRSGEEVKSGGSNDDLYETSTLSSERHFLGNTHGKHTLDSPVLPDNLASFMFLINCSTCLTEPFILKFPPTKNFLF